MSDDLSTYRLRIGLHYHRHLKVKGLKFSYTFELLIDLSLILIRCGDIELYPGPELDSDSSISTASAFSDLELKINSQLNTTMSKEYLIKLILFSQNCINLM